MEHFSYPIAHKEERGRHYLSMSDEILNIIQEAIADVEARLEQGPPAIGHYHDAKPERLSRFFEGIPHFASAIFPKRLQQYMTAFSCVPVAAYWPEQQGQQVQKFEVRYEERPNFNGNRLEWDASPSWGQAWMVRHYEHQGVIEFMTPEFLSWCQKGGDPLHYMCADIKDAYDKLLNLRRANRLAVPKTFSSLDIYSFFMGTSLEKPVVASMNALAKRIVQAVERLEHPQRTKDALAGIICDETSLPVNSMYVASLINRLALNQRLGIYANERHEQLAGIFFEVAQRCGHMDSRSYHSAMVKACYEKGFSEIDVIGRVGREMRKVLGCYYDEIIQSYKERREPPNPHLIKTRPIIPIKIRAADTTSVDVRQIIEEATLGTGQRDASSLNHSALYRHPKVPKATVKPKADKREP
jgi:hypothetical protein